ncbi:hypothetical protein BGZ80_010324 [Entomortierella chlamydospora]|uniref:Protein yippee-like n=1 Tax=Entomortierella chlamydospora TaxID=101097 RepID=A0A9P6MW95_9FUNG|nr:hypothetical protein BGZ80_010324 [Entomortierella chlamydospora]
MDASLPHQVYLKGDQIYTCNSCHAHLARNEDIISKVRLTATHSRSTHARHNKIRPIIILTYSLYKLQLLLFYKGFQGRHGRAYLFKNVQNITLGPKEDRILMTGLHSVADISCTICQSVIGWIYIYAFEEAQKYKEGKYIVEKAKISKENFWIQNE